MSHASLRSLRRGLCSTLAALYLVFGSLAPAFAADPAPVDPNGQAVGTSADQTPVGAPAPAATGAATPASPPPSGTSTAGGSASPATSEVPSAAATPSPATPIAVATSVVTTAVATAQDVKPPALPTVVPPSATPTASPTVVPPSATPTESPSATPTPAAQSGTADAQAGAAIEQYNIQIIQGTPDPAGSVTQDATNSIVANQRAAAASGVATGGVAAAGGADLNALTGQSTGSAASSGGVLAVAAAVIRQINVQVITSYSGQGAITQTASNSVVLNQDVAAQSGNAVATGSGSGVAGNAQASAVTSRTQVNAQIHVSKTGPLTADEVIALVMAYLNGTLPANGGAQNVTQAAKSDAQVNQQVSAAVKQSPTGTPGTGVAVSSAAASTPATGSSPSAATTGKSTNAAPSGSGSALSGDALISALVFVGQINVQLISGLFGNGQAIQSASNTLNVDQTLAATSGSATAADGGSAKSGGAKIESRVSLDQLRAQVTLSGVGAGAVAAAQSGNDIIAAIINLLFRSAAPGTSTVAQQQSANRAVVQQGLRIPGTPTPEPKPSATSTAKPTNSSGAPNNSPAAQVVLGAHTCQFVHGFRALHDAIPLVVGDCRTDENFAVNGDAVQLTAQGILVWRKADNFTAFTNGREIWILGRTGITKHDITDW